MLRKFLNLFRRKQQEEDDEAAAAWEEEKSALMEGILGAEHEMVMHALIPYAVGGALDLYLYPNDISGVGIATKELCESPQEGSSNDYFKAYEIAMFTKHDLDLDACDDEDSDFGKMHANISSILNVIAPYSAAETLNPKETCEFPEDMDDVGGKCLIFDAYNSAEPSPFGVMVVIEIFRSEMVYAMENKGKSLLKKLKAAGHYPYSDLNREPVVRG